MIRRWAGWLDNWLSVDELGGCLGEALVDDPALLAEVQFLAGSASPWQRRLYVVGLIRPDEGSVKFNQRDITRLPMHQRDELADIKAGAAAKGDDAVMLAGPIGLDAGMDIGLDRIGSDIGEQLDLEPC